MTSQDVFWINAAIGIAFVAIFMYRKAPRGPTRLKLRAGMTSPGESDPNERGLVRQKYDAISIEALAAQSLHPREKTLNVLFNYNGHTWDAFEVLGLPAGAPARMVEEAYQVALRKASPEGRDFIRSAYDAIRSRVHPRGP